MFPLAMMRAKFPQADGRGILPRKWSADKFGGPLLYFSELVLKRLIQQGFPASYRAMSNGRDPRFVLFENEFGETSLFMRALIDSIEIIARRVRCVVCRDGCMLSLSGEWRLDLTWVVLDSGRTTCTRAKFVRVAPPF